MFPSYAENLEGNHTPPRLSGFSDIDQGLDSWQVGRRSLDLSASPERTSYASVESGKTYTSQTMVKKFTTNSVLKALNFY